MKLDPPVTCLITRGILTADSYESTKASVTDAIQAAVAAGVSMVQLREKALTAKQVLDLATSAAEIVAGSETIILVNDRFDLALAAGVAGVHLRSDSIAAAVVRKLAPPDFVIGVSAHSLDDVVAARAGGADFAVFGPVFETPEKGEPVGLPALGKVCGAVAPFPVLALGGIDASNVDAVLEAGAAGYAAIRFMHDAEGLRLSGRLRTKTDE